MTKFGLNGFLEQTKGASLRYKLREFWWQLRYAWQRAWRDKMLEMITEGF